MESDLVARATRENNWELHLSAVRLMLPWFFVADRIHYARYGTMYWLEMSCLENTHPGKVLLISWLDLVTQFQLQIINFLQVALIESNQVAHSRMDAAYRKYLKNIF